MALPLAISSAGCYAPRSDSGDDYEEEDLPSGTCDTEGSSSTGCEVGPVADECSRSEECSNGGSCQAEFDGELGVFECRNDCVETLDDARWCTDDASCCDPAARCLGRGYCVVPDSQTSTSSDDGGSSSTAASSSGGDSSSGSDSTGGGG